MARAIHIGSAPTADAAQRGIEDRRVKLGCSISDGVGLLTWEHDAFALVDSFDDEGKRYRRFAGMVAS